MFCISSSFTSLYFSASLHDCIRLNMSSDVYHPVGFFSCSWFLFMFASSHSTHGRDARILHHENHHVLVRSPAEATPSPLEAVLERVPFGLRAPALPLELHESLAVLTPPLQRTAPAQTGASRPLPTPSTPPESRRAHPEGRPQHASVDGPPAPLPLGGPLGHPAPLRVPLALGGDSSRARRGPLTRVRRGPLSRARRGRLSPARAGDCSLSRAEPPTLAAGAAAVLSE